MILRRKILESGIPFWGTFRLSSYNGLVCILQRKMKDLHLRQVSVINGFHFYCFYRTKYIKTCKCKNTIAENRKNSSFLDRYRIRSLISKVFLYARPSKFSNIGRICFVLQFHSELTHKQHQEKWAQSEKSGLQAISRDIS